MELKWLTNTEKSPVMFMTRPGQTQLEAKREHDAYLSDKIIGEPKATETCSQYQLKQMGMVGVYKYVEPTEDDLRQQFDDFISGKTDHLGVL